MLDKINFLLVLFFYSAVSFAEAPPEFKPYVLPTFSGTEAVISNHVEPLIKAPEINADKIYQRVLSCYPHKSKWNIDVELRGGFSSEEINDGYGSSIGRNYVQIVMSMPLYSAKELDRAVRNEHDLRQETAKTVAEFVKSIATRNHALREIALYSSLERRSAVRVKSGVAVSAEQVEYLEKVARSHESLLKAEADIMTNRIALSAMCAGGNYKAMNNYLINLSEEPGK